MLVRLLFGLGLALGSLAVLLLLFAGFWSSLLGDGAGSRPSRYVVVLAIAGVLGLTALCVSLGPFPTRAAAALTWSGMALLSASIVAVMLSMIFNRHGPTLSRPPRGRLPWWIPRPVGRIPPRTAGTGFPGEGPARW